MQTMLSELNKQFERCSKSVKMMPYGCAEAEEFLAKHGPALIAAVELAESCSHEKAGWSGCYEDMFDHDLWDAYRAAKENHTPDGDQQL